MSRTVPIGNDSFVAALMTPTTNWGQRMAARDQQLRTQYAITQQAQNELLGEQQAVAQVANFKDKIRQLPLERPDKLNVGRWLTAQDAALQKRLAQEYKGNFTQFVAAEGSQWMQHTLELLEQSPEYAQGQRNLEQITLAKDAMKKGENLVGEVRTVGGKQTYVPATQQLADYYAGKTPGFTFSGSYKDDDSLIKHFNSDYAPGQSPFVQTAVSEAEKQNYLLATNDRPVALDKYMRRYKDATVYYKTKPLDEKLEFDNKLEDRAIKHKMQAAQYEGIGLSNELKRKKLSVLNNAAGGGSDPGAYLRQMIPQSTPQPDLAYDDDPELAGNKVLRHAGYDLAAFGGKATGKASFSAIDILDKQSAGALGNLVGAEKVPVTKENPSGWQGGQVMEGILDGKGFNAVDLSGTAHRITHIDPKIYTNPRELTNNGQAVSPGGPMGFLKVRVQLGSGDDAKKAGLEGFLGRKTKLGTTAAYNADTREVTIYTPVGQLYKNAALNRFLSNQDAGSKLTNDFMNPFALGVDYE